MLRFKKTYQAPLDSGKAILGRTLPSLLDEKYNCSNDRAFNQWREAGWQSLSNDALRNGVEEVALGLLDLPLEKGDRVALLMHSDVNFCLVDLGCLLANLINVPIDLSQTIENIVFAIQHSEAKVLVVSNLDLLSQIAPYLRGVSTLKTAIVAEVSADWQQIKAQLTLCQFNHHKDEDPATVGLFLPKFLIQTKHEKTPPEVPSCLQVFSLEEIRVKGLAQHSQAKKQELQSALATEVATIIYIPEPSGRLQGVTLTHENLSFNALAEFTGLPDLKLGAEEVVLSFLPLTHVFARTLLYGHINYGHSIYFTNPNRVIKHLQEVQPTLFATVPLLLEKVYSQILEESGKHTKRSPKISSFDPPHSPLAKGGGRGEGRGTRGVKKHRKQRETDAAGRRSWHSSLKLHFFKSRDRFQFLEQMLTPVVVSWALKLAKEYEIGEQPKGWYALQLKIADRLVFCKWRAVFGGRIKYLLSGGAGLKAEIANLFAAAGITILQGYGLTETSAAIAYNRGSFNRAGTVGVPIAGVEIAIADDGEILIRGPCVMAGYYKNPEATQQVIDADGWFHTGDLGEFTEDGFLKITGLKKSPFKLSTGKYVTPVPLESKLKQSSLVAKAIAVGAERKFCAMLIFPNLDALHEKLRPMSLNLATEELLKHPCVLSLYQALVDEANCHLPYWSTVKRFAIVNATLSIENGMLSPTGEVIRAKIVETFAKEIDALYVEEKTERKSDVRVRNIDEEPISEFPCPSVAPATCPVYARSLNHY
ncbi:MAG: AMP-binding protein [Hydrococcus sp. RU_2_2]|nr:AMP-binding protein [Hydrococcus sp. RU_2_2]